MATRGIQVNCSWAVDCPQRRPGRCWSKARSANGPMLRCCAPCSSVAAHCSKWRRPRHAKSAGLQTFLRSPACSHRGSSLALSPAVFGLCVGCQSALGSNQALARRGANLGAAGGDLRWRVALAAAQGMSRAQVALFCCPPDWVMSRGVVKVVNSGRLRSTCSARHCVGCVCLHHGESPPPVVLHHSPPKRCPLPRHRRISSPVHTVGRKVHHNELVGRVEVDGLPVNAQESESARF